MLPTLPHPFLLSGNRDGDVGWGSYKSRKQRRAIPAGTDSSLYSPGATETKETGGRRRKKTNLLTDIFLRSRPNALADDERGGGKRASDTITGSG